MWIPPIKHTLHTLSQEVATGQTTGFNLTGARVRFKERVTAIDAGSITLSYEEQDPDDSQWYALAQADTVNNGDEPMTQVTEVIGLSGRPVRAVFTLAGGASAITFSVFAEEIHEG